MIASKVHKVRVLACAVWGQALGRLASLAPWRILCGRARAWPLAPSERRARRAIAIARGSTHRTVTRRHTAKCDGIYHHVVHGEQRKYAYAVDKAKASQPHAAARVRAAI
jgi:hypothetical protein